MGHQEWTGFQKGGMVADKLLHDGTKAQRNKRLAVFIQKMVLLEWFARLQKKEFYHLNHFLLYYLSFFALFLLTVLMLVLLTFNDNHLLKCISQ